jgi:hypothetical protein
MEINESVWVVTAPGMLVGARILGKAYDRGAKGHSGKTWLDVCILGQHLPQMYSNGDIRILTSENCPALGLCPECFGFGDMDDPPADNFLSLARSIDQMANLCTTCGGSGRPAIRVSVHREPNATEYVPPTGTITTVPHAYIPPLSDELLGFYAEPEMRTLFGSNPDDCLACGLPPGDEKHARGTFANIHN